jgi:DNA-binding XRE family transcriptional regulator
MKKTHKPQAYLLAKDLFLKAAFTQQEIAQKVGITKRTLYNWMQEGQWANLLKMAKEAPSILTKNIQVSILDFQNAIKHRPEGQRYPTPQETQMLATLLNLIDVIKECPVANFAPFALKIQRLAFKENAALRPTSNKPAISHPSMPWESGNFTEKAIHSTDNQQDVQLLIVETRWKKGEISPAPQSTENQSMLTHKNTSFTSSLISNPSIPWKSGNATKNTFHNIDNQQDTHFLTEETRWEKGEISPAHQSTENQSILNHKNTPFTSSQIPNPSIPWESGNSTEKAIHSADNQQDVQLLTVETTWKKGEIPQPLSNNESTPQITHPKPYPTLSQVRETILKEEETNYGPQQEGDENKPTIAQWFLNSKNYLADLKKENVVQKEDENANSAAEWYQQVQDSTTNQEFNNSRNWYLH